MTRPIIALAGEGSMFIPQNVAFHGVRLCSGITLLLSAVLDTDTDAEDAIAFHLGFKKNGVLTEIQFEHLLPAEQVFGDRDYRIVSFLTHPSNPEGSVERMHNLIASQVANALGRLTIECKGWDSMPGEVSCTLQLPGAEGVHLTLEQGNHESFLLNTVLEAIEAEHYTGE